MAHGDRFGACHFEGEEAAHAAVLRLLQDGQPIELPEVCGVRACTLTVGMYRRDAAIALVGLIGPDQDGESSLVSVYPVPLPGAHQTLTVTEVAEDCGGIEAWISGETALGIPITFFAADYFIDPDRYSVGRQLKVALAGLAYAAELADVDELDVELPGEGKVTVSTVGAGMILPMTGGDPGDFAIRGPVRAAEATEGGAYHLLSVTVAYGGDDYDEPLDIPILAATSAWTGRPPVQGSDVAAVICLFGSLPDAPWCRSTAEREVSA